MDLYTEPCEPEQTTQKQGNNLKEEAKHLNFN